MMENVSQPHSYFWFRFYSLFPLYGILSWPWKTLILYPGSSQQRFTVLQFRPKHHLPQHICHWTCATHHSYCMCTVSLFRCSSLWLCRGYFCICCCLAEWIFYNSVDWPVPHLWGWTRKTLNLLASAFSSWYLHWQMEVNNDRQGCFYTLWTSSRTSEEE